jgi:hypothetical protein
VNSSDEDFSPSSTLFICNKWDVVPITDRDEVSILMLEGGQLRLLNIISLISVYLSQSKKNII